MPEVTPALVKELRDRTEASMSECKKALTATNGNIELAIKKLRKEGAYQGYKKADAGPGVVVIKQNDSAAVMVEVLAETDFAGMNPVLKSFAEAVTTAALNEKISDLEKLQKRCEDERARAESQLIERVKIERLCYMELDSKFVGLCVKDNLCGVLVLGSSNDTEALNGVALHIAAVQPKYIRSQDIPEDEAVEGSSSTALLEQQFVMNPAMTVDQFLKSRNLEIASFKLYMVGETVPAPEVVNFADFQQRAG